MKPTIAIPQMGSDFFRKYMKSKYRKSLKRAGAEVRWIELEDTDRAIAEMLECDGLLLPGGADVGPELYGQQPSEKCGKPNTLRDTAEKAMIAAFIPTGKPVLGICRGAQMLNVCLGGTLYQDIKDTQKCKHSDFFSRARSSHAVDITEGSRLHGLLATSHADVNSIHHQAIDKVGDGLTVCAVSSDGFVEGVEMPEHPFCVAVQWHPEHMSAKSEQQRKLFDGFVAACRGE